MAVELPEWIVDISAEWALKLIVFQLYGTNPPSGGGGGGITTNGLTDAQLRATPVPVTSSGVQETRTPSSLSADNTVAAGAFSVSIFPLSGFVGTILGLPWVEANGAWNDSAQPGNTLPSYAITRSAGSYYLIVGKTP